MSISFDCRGSVRHLNTRKEGPDEERVLACDVKIIARTDPDLLVQLEPTLKSMCFRTDKAELRYPQIRSFEWAGEIMHMRLGLGGVELLDVTLAKLEIAPFINGKGVPCVDFTFSARTKPEGDEVALLAELLLEEDVRIVVQPMGDLFTPSTEAGGAA